MDFKLSDYTRWIRMGHVTSCDCMLFHDGYTYMPLFCILDTAAECQVLSIYELFKFLGFQRIGTVYGYRGINNLAKDLLLEMMANDNAAGTYSWTSLFTHRVEFIEDAQTAVDLAASKDSRTA